MIVNNRIIPGISGVGGVNPNIGSSQSTNQGSGISFEALLQKQIYDTKEVKFSKHAQSRLETRNIDLTSEQLNKLNESINKANAKGVKDSLVLVDDIAFVVNVKDKAVVTVMNKDEMKENVFSNIDGAVIA
ncbi:MAG: flagellar biosynthesis protein [Clostridiales bacterium]|nr:flagellar biosynthesis protein [Clostridiales bacterium]